MNKHIGLMYFMYCAFVHACFVAQSCLTLQAHGFVSYAPLIHVVISSKRDGVLYNSSSRDLS